MSEEIDTGAADSVHFGISKDPAYIAPVRPPVPPPPAPPLITAGEPRPGPTAEELVLAVNAKIESMEKTLMAQLEKRLAENSAPPAPASPPSPVPALLLQKIGELETRFKDYQERSLISAGQFKSIEESKIGARREIEALLKAVREQHKFSELDRQMHEQLQKSWARVEDLEKKLMELFAASSKPAPAQPPPADADAIARAVEAAVTGKLASMEIAFSGRLSAFSAKLEAEIAAQAEARRVPAEIFEKLSALGFELREARSAAGGALKEGRGAILEEIAGLVRTALREESSLVEKYSGEMLSLAGERQDALAKNVSSQVDRLVMQAEESSGRAAALSLNVEKASAAAVGRSKVLADELKSALAGFSADVSRKIEEAHKAHLAGIKSVCAQAGTSLGRLEAALHSISRLRERMAVMERKIGGIVKNLDSVNLAAVLGVTGVMVRENHEALKESLGKFSEEEAFLKDAEDKISAVLKAGGAD